MTKLELLKHKKDFTSPCFLLKIFKDEEEIPPEIVQLMFHKLKVTDYETSVGTAIMEQLRSLIEE